jgi:DNA-binding response OmpR family regulator
VVDDDNALRASISRILEEEGYTVDSAADGAAALTIVERDPPDAILLDVMMPGMNGRQFLHELRTASDGPHIPVVVMTALQGLHDRAIEYGADDLVQKPFDVDELLNKVALALFRSGEYDTLTDRPPASAAGNAPAPTGEPARELRGVILVLDEDKESLAKLDGQLGDHGFTVVSMSRATDELTRLALVLDPKAIALALRGPEPMALDALRRLRNDRALDAVPILVFADSADDLDPHREEIASLSARSVMPAARLTEVLE